MSYHDFISTLRNHAQAIQQTALRDLFTQDAQRFNHFSLKINGLLFDYSKNLISNETLQLLEDLLKHVHIEEKRDAMFRGEMINTTERRPALHTALRSRANTPCLLNGHDINQDVHAILEKMRLCTEQLRQGLWRGYNQQKITDVINIGIGGSDLGPKMAYHALRPYVNAPFKIHFVSNVDASHLDEVLKHCAPETTLFIISSKSFTTYETLLNAESAKAWFIQNAQHTDLSQHFIAISENIPAATQFGIKKENIFPIWDWVGGRYSIWSAIGLSLALAIGFEHFTDFLAGGYAMDQHFCNAPILQNMPMLLAMVGIWNRNFLHYPTLSITPYLEDLYYFPSFLQQLEMESNGKSVQHDGTSTVLESSPIIWGNAGTDCQHAYFQLLHQGADIIPVDFIAAITPHHTYQQHHVALLANCFAQSQALMQGKTKEQAKAELNTSSEAMLRLVPHRTFSGNRPSNTLLMDQLTPFALGNLIALYEHKVFVQGVVWNVNSFDQWGVELGKTLAKHIQIALNEPSCYGEDSSTEGLIQAVKNKLS